MSRGLLAVLVALGVLASGCGDTSTAPPRSDPTLTHASERPSSPVSPTSAPPQVPPTYTLTAGSAVDCSHGTSAQSGRHPLRQTAALDGITATLTGRPAGGGAYAWRDLRLQVKAHGRAPTQVRLTVPHNFEGSVDPRALQLESVDPAGRGAFCLGRMLGTKVVAVAGVRLGNNCCSGLVAVPVAPGPAGQPHWFGFDGNGVRIVTIGNRARVVSSVWMGCTRFWACAGGGDSIVVDDSDGTRLDEVTQAFPRLLQADARYLRAQISPTHPARTSGGIAAWIA